MFTEESKPRETAASPHLLPGLPDERGRWILPNDGCTQYPWIALKSSLDFSFGTWERGTMCSPRATAAQSQSKTTADGRRHGRGCVNVSVSSVGHSLCNTASDTESMRPDPQSEKLSESRNPTGTSRELPKCKEYSTRGQPSSASWMWTRCRGPLPQAKLLKRQACNGWADIGAQHDHPTLENHPVSWNQRHCIGPSASITESIQLQSSKAQFLLRKLARCKLDTFLNTLILIS